MVSLVYRGGPGNFETSMLESCPTQNPVLSLVRENAFKTEDAISMNQWRGEDRCSEQCPGESRHG